MVATRSIYGSYDIFVRYAKSSNRHRSHKWRSWKLDLVGVFANWNANCIYIF